MRGSERGVKMRSRDYKSEAEKGSAGPKVLIWGCACYINSLCLPARLKSGCTIQPEHVRSQSQPGRYVQPRRDAAGGHRDNMNETPGVTTTRVHHRAGKLVLRLVASEQNPLCSGALTRVDSTAWSHHSGSKGFSKGRLILSVRLVSLLI